ncbi:MAG TPA: TIGR03435 family protein [Bryobacteraceae bacterium]|nr:TIGR03435 family protein [Bryobacteraceae bacterium]
MRLIFCLAAICAPAAAQTARFEAASVKMRAADAPIVMIGGAPEGSRLALEAMSLAELVSWAYDMKVTQVVGGPSWARQARERSTLDSGVRRFDIMAKAEDGMMPSVGDFRGMMRALLAERFALMVHREPRETAVYVLTVDKKGVKFSASAPDAKGILRMRGGGRIIGSGATMAQLAGWFSNANGVDRPVVDETGLSGRYDFALEWGNPENAGAAIFSTAGPSIFTAMPEQLGLRLEPKRVVLEYVVIDRAALPGGN